MLKSPDNYDYDPLHKKRILSEDESTDIDEPILKKRIILEDEATDIDDEATDIDDEATDVDDEPIKSTELNDTSLFNPLVLMVMTHGLIPCENDDRYSTTRIPDGMELIKISIAEEGLVSCDDQNESVNKYLIDINDRLPQLLNKNLNQRVLNDMVDEFRRSHSLVYIPRINKKINKIKKNKKKTSIDEIDLKDYEEFLEGYETGGFKIHRLFSGDVIANKTYYRLFKEKNGNQFSIIEMNKPIFRLSSMEKIPQMKDLLSEFYPDITYPPDDRHTINLEKILQHYKRLGITRLILFDFSCSLYSYINLGVRQPRIDKFRMNYIKELNKDIPSGGKYNKKSYKRKSYKRKTCKRKTCKRKTCKRKTCKRKSYKRKTCKKKNL
jgi:hypothetical protein